ncbi:adenine-specific methyltransferase EcoRI family protein [Mycoplasma corogypsi]|uniref:adenine-specific methyltransferase EcoRI family protein n=1 Tax=Mycoplasma corogypsi TaxID=2106 RepID=UPI003873214B
MKKNSNLTKAKNAKNDEFYTQYNDVASELMNYEEQLRNKAILCPCDYDFDKLPKEQQEEFFNNGYVSGIKDNFAFSQFFHS